MKEHEELLQGIEDEPFEEDKPSPWKKISVILLGLLLLGLTLPYFTFGPVYSTLPGILSSEQPEGNALVFDNVQIVFQGNTVEYLSELYTDEQGIRAVETAACLLGSKQGSAYVVDEIYRPEIHAQEFNHVRFSACPQDTLIMLHTHPELRCQASDTDLATNSEYEYYRT